MKTTINFLATMIISICLLLQCSEAPSKNQGAEISSETIKDSIVKKGKYLVTILGCNDCHSPKRMGTHGPELIPELMLSGYPSSRPLGEIPKDAIAKGWALFNGDLTVGLGPWGASFAANLTPDETGIGNWSLDQFKTSLTKGKSKGLENGRPLMPPMPWYNYANMSDGDVEAIYSYLMSIKPVINVVPAYLAPDAL